MGTAISTYGLKKNLPYARFINYEITKLRQSGMLDLMSERYSLKQPKCLEEDSQNKKVSFYKLILPFSIIFVGIGIAFIILSVEHFYSKSQYGREESNKSVENNCRNFTGNCVGY